MESNCLTCQYGLLKTLDHIPELVCMLQSGAVVIECPEYLEKGGE